MNALPRILARFTFLRCLALLGLMLGAASPALAAKTYSDNGDGTVTDPTTGLQWMRCSMGQTWDGTTCAGTTSTYTWAQAFALTGTVTFAGQSDWRLPNIRELQTIVDRSTSYPAIDAVVFPNTPWAEFWSASASPSDSSFAWDVYSGYGSAQSGSKSYGWQVRLVRAGQSFGLLDIARPSTDYVDQGNGTVTHTPTRLTWQRCTVGQTWTGSTCSGTASVFTWDAAKVLTSSFAGQTDWRLPTEEELLSLVDYNKYSPAINTTLFPNTPPSNFWSASAIAYYSSGAWGVDFYYGYASGSGNQVRLVRAGQSFALLTLTVSKTGTGQVNSSVWPGIACGTVCSSGYYPGDMVTLNATPSANFISWGGACAGTTATCIVTMGAAKSVTASFIDLPVVSVLPATLTFATQNIGSTSTAQTARLSNSGTAALTISSIATSGDYGVSHNCGTGLGAGGFCTLNITFSPTASGTRTGNVTVISNAPGSPHGISLSGTGQGSTSVVSASTLSFAMQGVGSTSAGQTLTLSNTGGAVLNIESIVANGDFAYTTTCGATLAQAASCTISVTFIPTFAGARSGSLVVNSDGVGNPSTITLSGTGQGGLVSLSAAAQTFANQGIGTSSSAKTITLTNTGMAVLHTTGIVVNGDFAQTTTCGATLAQAASCSISVTFAPTVVGVRSGSVVITSDAASSPDTISLSGTGAAVALVSLSPASLSFVSQGVGTSSTAQTIAFTNSGGASLNLTSITASGDFAVTNNCGGGLAAGGSCSLNVIFTPTAAGTRTGTITITSNATGSPHSVSLSGTIGTLTPPTCTLSASPVVISAGSTSTLSASCTPDATSYVWTNSGFGSGVSNGAVSPATPTIYTVVASNAAGSGNTASTAVYVCNTPPSQYYAGQTLIGSPANDTFQSTIGNDNIDGGAGIDTVIDNCNRASFTVTNTTPSPALSAAAPTKAALSVERPQSSIQPVTLDSSGKPTQTLLLRQATVSAVANIATSWIVNSAAEGLDTLSNIERLQFADEVLALDIDGNAGQAYRLYQAAFDRTPDNAGLKYWTGVMDNGEPLQNVAANFINSDEFRTIYGTDPTVEQYVTRLYANVLHRAPEQAGYDYWVNVLNNHWITYGDTLMYFSESAENQAGVLPAIQNGIDLLN